MIQEKVILIKKKIIISKDKNKKLNLNNNNNHNTNSSLIKHNKNLSNNSEFKKIQLNLFHLKIKSQKIYLN